MTRRHFSGKAERLDRNVVVIYAPYALSLSRNATRYQHPMALAHRFRLLVLVGKGPYPEELAKRANVRMCLGANLKLAGRFFYFFAVLLMVGRLCYRSRLRGEGRVLLITTYQPICIVAGAVAQRIFHVKWVADVFDVPALGLEMTDQEQTTQIRRVSSMPRRLFTELAYRVLKSADRILCTLVPDALAQYSISPQKILALTNGIELRESPPALVRSSNDADSLEVLYLGAVLRIRGLDTMLDACHLLSGRVTGLRLLLVGPSVSEERKFLVRRVNELGLETIVSFTGELPHEEAMHRVHKADICLFPFPRNHATEFIYPVKLFEYMAAGRAIIASDLAGVRRIIEDGQSGILVKPGDPQALADAIFLLWRSPEMRALIATNARVAALRFEWNRINGQMLEALCTLLQEHQ